MYPTAVLSHILLMSCGWSELVGWTTRVAWLLMVHMHHCLRVADMILIWLESESSFYLLRQHRPSALSWSARSVHTIDLAELSIHSLPSPSRPARLRLPPDNCRYQLQHDALVFFIGPHRTDVRTRADSSIHSGRNVKKTSIDLSVYSIDEEILCCWRLRCWPRWHPYRIGLHVPVIIYVMLNLSRCRLSFFLSGYESVQGRAGWGNVLCSLPWPRP